MSLACLWLPQVRRYQKLYVTIGLSHLKVGSSIMNTTTEMSCGAGHTRERWPDLVPTCALRVFKLKMKSRLITEKIN